MASNPVVLEEILTRHDWISTFTHPPDVVSLLRNNDPPSLPQSARLKESLASLNMPLSELQSDLNLLRGAVASVESRMSCLMSLKHDYETVLSPIRRIPSEITMEILRRAWENNGSGPRTLERRLYGFNVFAIREGPWHLGQVCRSWRNVVETLCPELWANMSVEVPDYCQPKVSLKADAALEVLRIILKCSRNHPLDFHLVSNYCPYPSDEDGIPQAMERCFHMMLAHSNRWRAVEMTLDSDILPELSVIRGKIDGLRDVYIYCSDVDSESVNINAFEVAPKLERLVLKGMHPGTEIRFPTANLISFSDARSFGGDRLTPEYLDLVKSAPKLRSFSYNDYSEYGISNPMIFLRVMSRSVKELSTASACFMRGLLLPSLEKCVLATGWDLGLEDVEAEDALSCPDDALGALHEMLLVSRCSLTKLHLVDVVLDDNLANAIRIMPDLREFVVKYDDWGGDYDPILQSLMTQLSAVSLVGRSPQHSMVPSLQSLCVYLDGLWRTHISFINSAFVDMVASRLRHHSDAPHLTKLDLYVEGKSWTCDLDEAAKDTLNSLRGEGLELVLNLVPG
ncbi:hypothetical protein EDD18DRAFT_1151490 [Armillaria luteobubalina]|uniref:F-box domain-containing protein n=1 Tax=Armillaria luteobubalina TaxID=153913 RepID=A0AA39UQW8_9AGAR|nr:hypothetical protein EDD18DRAFT_1151490 [Armillaria luteobubalina]